MEKKVTNAQSNNWRLFFAALSVAGIVATAGGLLVKVQANTKAVDRLTDKLETLYTAGQAAEDKRIQERRDDRQDAVNKRQDEEINRILLLLEARLK